VSAAAECGCLTDPLRLLADARHLGVDDRYGEASLLTCPACGRRWLRYFHEMEAFSRSGRWYLGLLDANRAPPAAGEARDLLSALPWYFFGGSFNDGRIGRGSGPIIL
jgi:hypothetical protein